MNTLDFPFEFKSINATGVVEGLAAAFGNIDAGGDKIIPGAFQKSLADRGDRPLPMLLHHDQRRPIGIWTDLKETPQGLSVRGRMTMQTRDAQEAHALATDGALAGLSIGYRVPSGGRRYDGKANVLTQIDLGEVSLVTLPMNDRATISSVKSIHGVRDLEDLLREGAGLSSRKAKAAAGAAWRALNQADDDTAGEAVLNDLFLKSAARIAAITKGN